MATKASSIGWSVAAIAAVIALALIGWLIQSTSDLVRLLRDPPPPATVTMAFDAETSGPALSTPDASLGADSEPGPESAPSAPSTDRATDGGPTTPAARDRWPPIPLVSNDANLFAFTTPDASDDSALRAARPVGTNVLDASRDVARPTEVVTSPISANAPPTAQPVRCGWRMCDPGQQCCNWNCSTCVFPGQTCPLFCGAPTVPISAQCGPNTCNVGEVCCNASCGICVSAGGTCSHEPCTGMYVPFSLPCGMNTCNAGQVCCNPSCGICTNPGETCSLDPC